MTTLLEPTYEADLDLDISLTTFTTPGAGMMADEPDEGDDDKKGPITLGTTCWGTPCPSANTISC